MDKLELEVTLTQKQYYHFNLYHCYHSFNGFLSVFLGILCMAYGVFGIMDEGSYTTIQIVCFFVFGLVVLVYNPVSLYLRSKNRFLRNKVMKKPVTYVFSDTGIALKQGSVEEEMKWENLYKVVKTKESMIFYLTKYNANIVPLSEMKGRYDEVCAYISQYADKRAVKFKIM